MRDRFSTSAAILACVFLLAAASFLRASGPAPGETAKLRNEDIVRMRVSGASERDLIATIRSSPAEFDLSEEMVQELRIAGVPDAVIRAMRERQAELHPSRETASTPTAPDAGGKIRLVISLAAPPDRALAVTSPLAEAAARSLDLGPADADRTVADLAVFVACATAEHVPDQWRSKSPLGRDFQGVPRHEILAFAGGARRETPRHGPARLRLELPADLGVLVEAGTRHDLVVGVAVRIGDRYLALSSARTARVARTAGERVEVLFVPENGGIAVRLGEAPEPPPSQPDGHRP